MFGYQDIPQMMLLELCEGNVSDLFIKKNEKISEWDWGDFEIKFQAIKQIASGGNYIHKCDFVHFDIKGANILYNITNDGYRFKISDFGVKFHVIVQLI